MGKNKLQRFAENETFKHLFQPSPKEMLTNDFFLKGKWNSDYFKNNHPIILEVGCGKGEYTVGLARKYKNKNFIGIDIKGSRLWRGSKTVKEENMKNVAFIRNKVEFSTSFFSENEISEIWITFPDPQIKKIKKRLTSARFLKMYSEILNSKGIIHLKTDSVLMHEFTKEIIKINKLETVFETNDLYNSEISGEVKEIKTFYEQIFLEEGLKITYLQFKLNGKSNFVNSEED